MTITLKSLKEPINTKATIEPDSDGWAAGVDETLEGRIFSSATRKYTGLMFDVDVIPADSRDLRALLRVGLTEAVRIQDESDGTTVPQDNELGALSIEYADSHGRLSNQTFNVFISDEVDMDTDLTQDIIDQSVLAVNEKFGDALLNASGALASSTDETFRGILGSRYNITAGTGESRKDDATRDREVYQSSFAGIDISTIASQADKANFAEAVDDFLCTLPSAYHKNAKVYMPRNVYGFLKKLRNDSGRRLFPETTDMKLGAYPIVLEDYIETDLSGPGPLMIFGDVNSAIGLRSLPAFIQNNPYALDGAILIRNKMRLIEFIKSNEALRVFSNGV